MTCRYDVEVWFSQDDPGDSERVKKVLWDYDQASLTDPDRGEWPPEDFKGFGTTATVHRAEIEAAVEHPASMVVEIADELREAGGPAGRRVVVRVRSRDYHSFDYVSGEPPEKPAEEPECCAPFPCTGPHQ